MSNRIDRRRFLVGTGGSLLALPMLEAFAPRTARGQQAAPPRRLVIVVHQNGRMVGNGQPGDLWSPGSTTGPLPSGAPSPMLAELADIRDEIVTIDGIDNIVRHVPKDTMCGHTDADLTTLTCKVAASKEQAGGPSLDYVAGLRLRANAAMQPSIILPASATPVGFYFTLLMCAGADGSDPTLHSGNPEIAVGEIFGDMKPAMMMNTQTPPPPSLHDRLIGRRSSILDGVVKNLTSLSGKLNSADRARLDQHATFIRTLETQLTGSVVGITPTKSCTRPDETKIPHVVPSTYDEFVAKGMDPVWLRGNKDMLTTPYQVENIVQALACDVARVAVLALCDDPNFSSEFPSGTPFVEDGSVHTTVHMTPTLADEPNATNLRTGFQLHAREFKMLVQRLAEMQDTDGTRLLDNTLVVWMSSLGYGSQHLVNNLPVVMAGMKSAFAQGQGRHLVQKRRTTGDLHAQILRMLGGTDMTFGETGTLGALAKANGISDLQPALGEPGYITADTPLHVGPLDL